MSLFRVALDGYLLYEGLRCTVVRCCPDILLCRIIQIRPVHVLNWLVCLIQSHLVCYNGYCFFHLPAGPDDFFDPPDRETMRLQKFGKLLAGPNTDLGESNRY